MRKIASARIGLSASRSILPYTPVKATTPSFATMTIAPESFFLAIISSITPSTRWSFSDESPTDSGVPWGSSPPAAEQPASHPRTRTDVANRFMPSSLRTDPRGERIARVAQERRLRGDERRPPDRRMDRPADDPHGPFEDAADDTLLAPDLSLFQLPVRHQAGELGGGSRAAGRPVVRLARTQHEVPAVGPGGRAEELDVVDLRVLAVHGPAQPPRVFGQGLDVVPLEALPVVLDEEEPVPPPGDVARDAVGDDPLLRPVAR